MIKVLNREYVFPIIVLIVTFVFSLLFPMYQVPDELKHIQMTYEELGQDFEVYETYCKYFDVIRIAGNPNELVNYGAYFNFDIKATSELKLTFPKLTLIRHLPQSISILIGHLFDLPVIIIVLLGELLAAVTYALSCYVVLKIMPFKHNIMKFIMLLPILIQQMGSFSYDVILISASFIYIAYILYLKFSKKRIILLDFVKIILLLAIMALTKIPYVLLGLLILILPVKKIDIKIFNIKINEKFILKYKKVLLFILALAIIMILYIMTKITIGKTLLAFLINPIGLIKIIIATLISHGTGFIYTIVGNLGWLDIKTSLIFCSFVAISSIIFNFFNYKNEKIEKQKFSKIEIAYLVCLFVFLCIIIMLSLFEWTLTTQYLIENYSSWSIKDISNYITNNNMAIDGIQGRYFVPFLPIVCLPIFSERISKKLYKYHKLFMTIYFIVLIIYLFFKVLFRYWI